MSEGHYWDSYSHKELYDMIHGGMGVAGAEEALAGWGELTALMDDARAETEAALAEAGASWEGVAADAMRSGVAPLAQWAADAHTAGRATLSSVDTHVVSFATSQNRMPEPVAADSGSGIPGIFKRLYGGQTDQDRLDAEAQEAKAEAVRVMAGYEVQSTVAQSTVGTFAPPPSVTVEVATPTPAGGQIGSVSGALIGPAGVGAGTSSTPSGNRATSPTTPVSPAGNAVTPSSVGATRSASQTQRSAGPVPSPDSSVPPGGGRTKNSVPPGGGRTKNDASTPGRAAVGGMPGRVGGGGSTGALGDKRSHGPGHSPQRGAGRPGGITGGITVGRGAATPGAAPARGAGGPGAVPVGIAGRGPGDEDTEHQTPAYLQSTHDDFWDDAPLVGPSVLGEEEE